MDNQKYLMKWVLFWVFLLFFAVVFVATFCTVFFGWGAPNDSERELLVNAFLLEIAGCMAALFYSIFGIKGTTENADAMQALENRFDKLSTDFSLLRSRTLSETTLGGTQEVAHTLERIQPFLSDFQASIDLLQQNAPFPNIYELRPLPTEIKTEIRNALPIDVKHKKGSYHGMKVQWKGVLSEIEEIDKDHLKVTVDLADSVLMGCFIVNRSNRLQVARKGEPMWLAGEIVEVTSTWIELKDVMVQLLDA